MAARTGIILMGHTLQRLYSNFANGLPGKGLLVLRLVLFVSLVQNCMGELNAEPLQGTTRALVTAACFCGLFLLGGLWTPIAGGLVALLELWFALVKPDEWHSAFLAIGIATALALLGPGSWSMDARVYGRKRISIQDR